MRDPLPLSSLLFSYLPAELQLRADIVGIARAEFAQRRSHLKMHGFERRREIRGDGPVGARWRIKPVPSPAAPRRARHDRRALLIDRVGGRLAPLQADARE